MSVNTESEAGAERHEECVARARASALFRHCTSLPSLESESKMRLFRSLKLNQHYWILSPLTDIAVVSKHKSAIVNHSTLCNVVSEVRFGDLVARIELDSNQICSSPIPDVTTVNPLTVNLRAVDIETSRRYALVTTPGAIPLLLKSRITLCVL